MAQTQANLDSEINTLLQSGIDITAATLRQVLHDMNAAVFQSGVTGLATPSAQIGLTAQAGSAGTAMRSDGAPALSQGITPVWAGIHVFASGVPATSPTTGALVVSNPGGIGVGGIVNAAGAIVSGTVGITGLLQVNGSTSGGSTITVTSLGNTAEVSGTLALYNGQAGAVSPVSAGQRVTGTVSGTVATTDISLIIPAGVTVLGIQIFTGTAFGASGSVNLTAGTGIGDNAYLTATNIKAFGVFSPAWNGASNGNLGSMPAGSPSGVPNMFLRLTQVGTPSGVGSATIIVDYIGGITS